MSSTPLYQFIFEIPFAVVAENREQAGEVFDRLTLELSETQPYDEVRVTDLEGEELPFGVVNKYGSFYDQEVDA